MLKAFDLSRFSRQDAMPAVGGGHGLHRRRHRARLLISLCVGMFLSAAIVHADAVTQIYLYDANHNPINVTASYSFQGQHIYDTYGNLVGTVNAYNQIDDSSDQVIGYIEPDGS